VAAERSVSDSETNLLKFELGISNDLANLFYRLP
jgi:hypothetical protein